MSFLLNAIVSSPVPEPPVTWSAAWRLLIALPVGFLVLLGVLWAGTALAGFVKRHAAAKAKSNLSATSPTSPEQISEENK